MKRWFLEGGCVVLAFLLCATSMIAADGPARLIKDINQLPSEDRGSYPEDFQRLGHLMVFRAFTHDAGIELWKTDGTAEGTALVKDVRPGRPDGLLWPGGNGKPGFVVVGEKVLFPANDGIHGWELWASDGTAAGTRMVKDIMPGPGSGLVDPQGEYSPSLMWLHAEYGETMYFLANDGVHGFELWRTDGTEAGTRLLKDIESGADSAYGSYGHYSFESAMLGSTVYFRAQSSLSGAELWKTDGTEAGTVMVKDINPGPAASGPYGLTALNGQLLFGATRDDTGQELWRSDGTASGTVLVSDITAGSFGSSPQHLTRIGDFVYFEVYQYLYRTDGTPSGTLRLHAFGTGSLPFFGELNGSLLFFADDGVHGFEPWISDGSPAGTVMLKDIYAGAGSSSFSYVLQVGGVAYFMADDGVHGKELWRSDGTEEGTRLVADLTPGPGASFLRSAVPWQGGILFSTSSGLYRTDPSQDGAPLVAALPSYVILAGFDDQALFSSYDDVHGQELWHTDGTGPGTGLLKDVNPLLRNQSSLPSLLGNLVTPSGPRTLFAATDEQGRALWATDGTSPGTTLIRRIRPMDAGPWGSPVLNGGLLFMADDGEHGTQPWRSDGTSGGTVMVKDLGGFPLSPPVAVGDRALFSYQDHDHGAELYVTDGTQDGTFLLLDIIPGPEGSSPRDLTAAGGLVYFIAYDSQFVRNLWRSDGTAAGTYPVRDFNAPGATCCSLMTPFQGKLFFTGNDGIHGIEPWLSDGTEAGTALLKDIRPGSASSYPPDFVEAGPYGYFGADDGTHGYELWRTDGTEGGTFLVRDILPGADSSHPDFLGALGDTVYFMALGTGLPGPEMWKSDGTDAGTVRVRGAFPDYPRAATVVDSAVLFSEWDEENGFELWRTDGTTQGTVLVQDVAPGPADSYPESFLRLGSRLLFRADDPTANIELFAGRAAILAGNADQGVRDLMAELRGIALPKGLSTSLTSMLRDASSALAAGNATRAIVSLETFVNHVQVQTPGKIDETAAAELIDFARDLVRMLDGEFDVAQPSFTRRPTPRRLKER